jgi:methyl-accepting chemotaxis protein
MAFTMANTMDKLVTKVSLISQSDFYISEITKQYDGFVSKGNLKKEELEQQKTNENQSLVSELNTMREQLEAIKVQINDREKKLSAIGSKYDPLLNDVNSKLSANTQAKNLITQSIEQVKQGINNNLK